MTRKDPAHRAYIQSLPCTVCERPAPSECAHVRMSRFCGETVPMDERGGMGLKPDDKWTVPMCHDCHAEQHAIGERAYWDIRGFNPITVAQRLYAISLLAGRV